MGIKSWLEKFLPPTIFIFNKELSILKDDNSIVVERLNIIYEENKNLLNRMAEVQSLQCLIKELSIKSERIEKDLNDIRDTVHDKETGFSTGGECFATDVVKQMWQIAGKESAVFAMAKMGKSKSLSNAFALREYALSKAGEGLFLEFGVFSGTSINQIAKLKPEDAVYGFDSFEGLPEKWRDGFDAEMFKMPSLPEVEKNVVLIKGLFNETLPSFLEFHPGSCSFIHIDCDIYSSTKTVLTLLANRIVPGTVIVFDEYFNYPTWEEHEHKALIEFLHDQNMECDYFAYVGSHQQVAVAIREG